MKTFIYLFGVHGYWQVKLALKQALEMSESDRVDRMRRNLEFSSRLTTLNWYEKQRWDLLIIFAKDIYWCWSAVAYPFWMTYGETWRLFIDLRFIVLVVCRAKEVLRDLKSVVKSTDAAESYAMGFGLGFRVMGVKAGTYICCVVITFRCSLSCHFISRHVRY